MRALRVFLILDAAVLFWLGVAFIVAPTLVAKMFGFFGMPSGVDYVLGMWGCALVTMAGGYAVAATNPIRHAVWIQVGIARGILEALVGLTFVLRGTLHWGQAGFGIFAGGLLALGYILLYPRQRPESPALEEN